MKNKNLTEIISIVFATTVLLFATSCTTMQTEVKTTVSDEQIAEITKQYELELIELDGRALALQDVGLSVSTSVQTVTQNSSQSSTPKANLKTTEDSVVLKSDIENYMTRLQKEISSPKMSRPLHCRLLALLGRATLLDEKPVASKKIYEEAFQIVPDDIQVQILSLRLENDYSKRLEKMPTTFEEHTAQLEVEQALIFYYMGQYKKAAASFDNAFSQLDEVYRTAYGKLRDTSWVLQSAVGTVTEDSTAKILSAEGMINLIQSETNLLVKITGGKTLKAKDIAKKLESQKIISTDISKKVGDRHSTLYRSDIAQVLWSLYINYKNPNADVNYAEQYADQQSPILDVKVDDVFFNSVAGCIENEIMSLQDGINFEPNKTLSGSEFIKILQNIK